MLSIIIPFIKTTIRTIKSKKSDNNAFTIFYFSFLVTGLSNIYRIIVIALSCIVFVLLIAVGLLTWRLTRAVTKKREKTPEVGTSYKGMQHETPLDQHASLGDGYLEPLEVMSSATSHYQSIHRNRTSAKCGNVVSNSGTDNGEEDELYVSIIP